MKSFSLIIFFFLILTQVNAENLNSLNLLDPVQSDSFAKRTDMSPEKLEELSKYIDKALKSKSSFISETSVSSAACTHCPKHVQLTGEINKVLAKMKEDSKVTKDEEVPISINRLNFMFYQVKSLQSDGSRTCNRYMDINPDLKPTKLDGDMELMAENVFKFEGITSAQIMDPTKEEIVYYYRGEGDQKNIIVQAVLTKDGGRFRYFYYRPTEKEKNPYGLPSLGEQDPEDATVKKAKAPVYPQFPDSTLAKKDERSPEDKITDNNKFNLHIDPRLETRFKVIPKNVQIANAEMSHNVGGVNGVRVDAKSNLSLKQGNEVVINVADEKGYQYVKVDLRTATNGATTSTITVPYEVTLGSSDNKDAYKLKGNVIDSNDLQVMTLSLTDSVTTHLRSELKKDKITGVSTYAVAKDYQIGKDELATVAVGSNEVRDKYVAFQHRKAVKDNLTMVLDVRVDENKKASLFYQMKLRF